MRVLSDHECYSMERLATTEDNMQTHEYARIAKRENFYFWHVGRREILDEALKRYLGANRQNLKILDYGCGPGGNILVLKNFGEVHGVDVSQTALNFAKMRGFKSLQKISDLHTPFPDATFDIVSSLDVFEHIDDDAGAISECYRILKPGGVLLVTVPAHHWLWSAHDVVLEHVRRYTHSELSQKLQKSHFLILGWSHFVTLAVPINGLRIVRDKVFKPKGEIDTYDVEFSPIVNRLLLGLLRLEKIFIRFCPIPFGSSLLVVAKKS